MRGAGAACCLGVDEAIKGQTCVGAHLTLSPDQVGSRPFECPLSIKKPLKRAARWRQVCKNDMCCDGNEAEGAFERLRKASFRAAFHALSCKKSSVAGL